MPYIRVFRSREFGHKAVVYDNYGNQINAVVKNGVLTARLDFSKRIGGVDKKFPHYWVVEADPARMVIHKITFFRLGNRSTAINCHLWLILRQGADHWTKVWSNFCPDEAEECTLEVCGGWAPTQEMIDEIFNYPSWPKFLTEDAYSLVGTPQRDDEGHPV